MSSSLIDRVAASINAKLVEVPVGFKWFVDPLFKGEVAFGGEESSGMSFLRKDGRVWTTDKDGLIPDLLAAEITAKTGKNPAQLHQEQVERFGESWYTENIYKVYAESFESPEALDKVLAEATEVVDKALAE